MYDKTLSNLAKRIASLASKPGECLNIQNNKRKKSISDILENNESDYIEVI